MKKNIIKITFIVFVIFSGTLLMYTFTMGRTIARNYFETPNLVTEFFYKASNSKDSYPITEDSEIVSEEINFAIESITHENLSNEQSFRTLGEKGKIDTEITTSYLKALGLERIKSEEVVLEIEPINETVIAGLKTKAEVINDIKDELESSFEFGTKRVDFLFFEQSVFEIDYATRAVHVGEFDLIEDSCNAFSSTPLFYDLEKENYVYDTDKLESFLDFECGDLSFPELTEVAMCADCTLYPVGKGYNLTPSYVPAVETYVTNGLEYTILPKPGEYLEQLITDAQAAGHNIGITSSYRSYETQVDTFEYWVNWNQTVFGYDRETAIIEANKVSAKPGFSEHQLGTTADINSIDCNAFEGYCTQNIDLWEWLDNNAHLYGFAMSYPEGREAESGYTYEPWHYRFIGVENATEFKKTDLILAQFLRQLETQKIKEKLIQL